MTTPSHAPRPGSLWNTRRAARPGTTWFSTWTTSSSQFEPGKRRTATCMRSALLPRGAVRDHDAEVLDHLVREEVAAHRLDARARVGSGIAIVEVELDVLADAHVLHLLEAEAGE